MKTKIAVGFVKWESGVQPEECGFIEEDGVLVMPTKDIDEESKSENLALEIARKYTLCDVRWVSIENQGFYEIIESEEKVVYLKFRVKLPSIMNNLECGMAWKNIRNIEENTYVPHLDLYRQMCVIK